MMYMRHAQTGAVIKMEENTNDYLPLRDVVFNTLRESILKGEMKPGERLMEIHLANKLGVSRTPIREAIRKLELEGLVTMIPRRGAEVAQITAKGLRDVLEVRQALDALAMLPVIAALDRKARKGGQDTSWRGMNPSQRRTLLTAGVCCGAMLALASAFQQMGIAMGTGAGKAGFITALYIVLVPLLGMLWGRRPAWLVWVAVLLSVGGLYLLCIGEGFSIAPGDGLLILCALCFSCLLYTSPSPRDA